MSDLTKRTVYVFAFNPMSNVYEFKALDTLMVHAIWMHEQVDNMVTYSSWSSSQKAEPHIQGHTGVDMDLNSQLLSCSLMSLPKY